LFVVDGS